MSIHFLDGTDRRVASNLYSTFGRFITRDCAFRKAIALPETDNAKTGGLARTYVRQNYLKTTPNCRLN